MEMIDDKMQAGYPARKDRGSVGACRIWMETWHDILAVMDRTRIDTLAAFESRFGDTQSLSSWSQDLAIELHNAGLDDPQFFRHRIAMCEAVVDRFSDSELPLDNFQCAIASSHAMLGDYETSDRLFRQWLTEQRQWVWGWTAWADTNWPHAASGTGDANKVERILQEGLSNVKGPDRVPILQALETLYQDTNRERDAAAVHQEIEQLRGDE